MVELPPTGPLTLCPSPTDRGTIHKVVESEERERSLVFNIMEIQPFHHPAAIQALSLDTERVSLPTPLQPMGLAGAAGQSSFACDLHVLLRASGPQGLPRQGWPGDLEMSIGAGGPELT